MIELLTSDPAILVMTGAGLLATGITIVRDARAQRRASGTIDQISLAVESEKLAA